MAEKYNKYKTVGETKTMKVCVAPYSTGTFTMPFTIPENLTTGFATGIMTLRYYMAFGVVTNSWLTMDPVAFLSVFIGKREIDEKNDEHVGRRKTALFGTLIQLKIKIDFSNLIH